MLHELKYLLQDLFFNKEDDHAKGRLVMLGSSVFSNIAAGLSGGVFYTGFLLGNDIHITDIGILTALPYLCSPLCIFSPLILNHFKKRRWVLFAARFCYHFINIIGLTLLPMLVKDPKMKVLGFGIIVVLANCFNYLFSTGYSAWHLNFIPDEVRSRYFPVSQCITNLVAGSMTIISSLAADAMSGTPQQLTIITILRFVAYFFALMDLLVLALPKEYPYPETKLTNPISMLKVPFSNKKYVICIVIYCLYSCCNNLTAGVLNAWLLTSIGISYTHINIINAVYFMFFLVFSPKWQVQIRTKGWLKTFSFAQIIMAPTFMIYLFLTPWNCLWLFTLLRLAQHTIGTGHNVAATNLPYLHMPEENRTSYIAAYQLMANLSLWGIITLGTGLHSFFENSAFVASLPVDGVQILMFITGLFSLGIGLFARHMCPYLEPQAER